MRRKTSFFLMAFLATTPTPHCVGATTTEDEILFFVIHVLKASSLVSKLGKAVAIDGADEMAARARHRSSRWEERHSRPGVPGIAEQRAASRIS